MKLSHFLVYAPCRENLEPYLATVFEIAKSAGADAKLVDVIAALPEEMGRFVTASHVRTLEELTQNERQIRLERIADELQDGITASVEIRWGKPSIELVRAAARDRSDIIFAPTESGAHGLAPKPCSSRGARPYRFGRFVRTGADPDVSSPPSTRSCTVKTATRSTCRSSIRRKHYATYSKANFMCCMCGES